MKPRRADPGRERADPRPAELLDRVAGDEAPDAAQASDAPSVAETIATGVPSAVPNSSPAAPARSGPGNIAHGQAATTTTMKTSGPAAAELVDAAR